jgi:hypothetical protein
MGMEFMAGAGAVVEDADCAWARSAREQKPVQLPAHAPAFESLNASPLAFRSVPARLIERGEDLLFSWSVYATLNLVDDPALLAIVFT